MSASRTPNISSKVRVSLPSIHEMFPEHMLHDSHCSPARLYDSTDRTLRAVRERTASFSHLTSGAHPPQRSPPPTAPKAPFEPTNPRFIEYDLRFRAPSYSFDVLRSDPKTSSLEHIASSSSYRQCSLSDPLVNEGLNHDDTGRRGAYFRQDHVPSSSSSPFVLSRLPPSSVFEQKQQKSSFSARDVEMQDGEDEQAGGGYSGSGGEIRKHVCPHCSKRFNRPSSLRIHINIHTNSKPFCCPYPACGRQFNVNSNMRRHHRNHTRGSSLSTDQTIRSSPSEDELEGEDSPRELEGDRRSPPFVYPPSRSATYQSSSSPVYTFSPSSADLFESPTFVHYPSSVPSSSTPRDMYTAQSPPSSSSSSSKSYVRACYQVSNSIRPRPSL